MEKTRYRDIEIATQCFSMERLIGKGSHGRVYKGVLESGKHVAVKKASTGLHLLGDNSKLDNEIQMLSSIKSQHIVNLLGVCQESGHKLLVMEFMANGSMEKLLHSAPEPPTWSSRAVMALQIGMAIQALHKVTPYPIIHRDIKSANVLIDSQRNAKLADFGLAVRAPPALLSAGDLLGCDHIHTSRDSVEAVPAGTIGYIDPCYTTPGKLSTKTDIFSFGVLLLEIVSGRRAMDIALEPASIIEWAMPLIEQKRVKEMYDSRVVLPNNMKRVARRMLKVAARCVSSKEEERPSIGEIVTELTSELQHRQFSVRGLLRSSLWRRHYYTVIKRKRTTTLTCESEQKGEEDAQLSIFRMRCKVSDGN
ncbi:serine/threonine-protein kinase-like protein At5g23170 isoform X1 [Aristolochia californica]|uniref:serine/threonine-protein kinase-like protein At5g23170 isoform X1 n=1 Tax=Aristolochia californica TaxID=171875 RepID=UPI0035DFE064